MLGIVANRLTACALPQFAAALGTAARFMSTSTDLKSVVASKIPEEQVGKGYHLALRVSK